MVKKVIVKEIPQKVKVIKELPIKKESLEEEIHESEAQKFINTISSDSEAVAPVLSSSENTRQQNQEIQRSRNQDETERETFQYRGAASPDNSNQYRSQQQTMQNIDRQRENSLQPNRAISSVLRERDFVQDNRMRNPDDIFRTPLSQDLNSQNEQRYEGADSQIKPRKTKTDFF